MIQFEARRDVSSIRSRFHFYLKFNSREINNRDHVFSSVDNIHIGLLAVAAALKLFSPYVDVNNA